MQTATACIVTFLVLTTSWSAQAQNAIPTSVTVPFTLDHNRMLVDAEIQRPDGTWRPVKVWVDTGNPDFIMSEALARDLGIDLSTATGNFETSARSVRIGGMPLDFSATKCRVMFQPFWLFAATHNDANLPSTILMNYQVVFDYPAGKLTLAAPGSMEPHGFRVGAAVHPQTGIVQIDVLIDGDTLSLALDNGASYSFISDSIVTALKARHLEWPSQVGALGCANMWGYWPAEEQTAPLLRVPEIIWGPASMHGVGLVGVPGLGEWYSRKTVRPVDGFLGPNAFKAYSVEIDYARAVVYFEKRADPDRHDLDLVGLTLRPEPDGGFSVLGVAQYEGRRSVDKVEPGDRLIQIGGVTTQGETMGAVIDALRGQPGETRVLTFDRGGETFTVDAVVRRFM